MERKVFRIVRDESIKLSLFITILSSVVMQN